MREFNIRDRDSRVSKFLKRLYDPHALFDAVMVVFNAVGQTFGRPSFGSFQIARPFEVLHGRMIGLILIERNLRGTTPRDNGFAQKARSRSLITFCTEKEVDGILMLIHRSIQIHLLPLKTNIRFINKPGVADWAMGPAPLFLKLGNKPLHPPQNRRVSQCNSTFLHHLHEIAIAEFVGDVSAYTEENNLLIKMPTFEEFRRIR